MGENVGYPLDKLGMKRKQGGESICVRKILLKILKSK